LFDAWVNQQESCCIAMQTILLIENDPPTLIARSLILRCFGYAVLEADSRGKAWSVCAEHRGPIHLTVMEVRLDHESVHEFFTRLQLVHPEMRALVLTDASSIRMAENLAMTCVCSFLHRPFQADDLADSIRALLDAPKERTVTSA
jgi:DNA-binding NtrC family response regulator